MKNKLKKISMILILVLTLQNILALGISPGRITVTPDRLDENFNITVFNSEHKETDILISCRGDLKEKIILSKNKIHFLSNQSSKVFSFRLDIKKMNKSKDSQGEIIINELNNAKSNVRLAVTTQIILKLSDSSNFTKEKIKKKTTLNNALILNSLIIIVLLIILFIISKKFIH